MAKVTITGDGALRHVLSLEEIARIRFMPIKETIVYECDGCGVREIDPDYDARKRWFEVRVRSRVSLTSKHLICLECARDFRQWLDDRRELYRQAEAAPVKVDDHPYR